MDNDIRFVLPNWLIDFDCDLVILFFEFTTVTLPRQALPGTHMQQSSSLARNHIAWARPRNMMARMERYCHDS